MNISNYIILNQLTITEPFKSLPQIQELAELLNHMSPQKRDEVFLEIWIPESSDHGYWTTNSLGTNFQFKIYLVSPAMFQSLQSIDNLIGAAPLPDFVTVAVRMANNRNSKYHTELVVSV